MMEEKKYTLKELYKLGQLSPNVFFYAEVKDKVNQLKACGMSNGQAVIHVAKEVGKSRQSIYKALKSGL